ncbi:MAG TPA: hypothetical protein VFX10_01850, partial [Nitrospira sp.]|nr:hypothetical protein [Nitrospira sp.]
MRRTLRYVESLSDARTPLADFFSILLELDPHAGAGMRILRFVAVVADILIGCVLKAQTRLIPSLPSIGANGFCIVFDDEVDRQTVVAAVFDCLMRDSRLR